MKKRIILISAASLFTIVFGIRVYCVNSKIRYPMNKYYSRSEEVEIESDFFDSNKENMNGYSIKVLNTELIPMEEFCEKYAVEEREPLLSSDYIYLVKVNVRNINNSSGEKAGINFGQYMVVNNSYMNYCEREAYPYVNDYKSLGFSLREGTDKDFIIPFAINKNHISEEDFRKGNPQLIVSLYPTRKAISLTSN